MSEKRAEGTARVTAAVVTWLWRRGARVIVPEVGLHAVRGLARPWQGKWRVDIVGAVAKDGAESLHVIEVKGSAADIAREDLTTGKWLLDYERLGLNPWLAVADTVAPSHYADLSEAWGLIQVHGTRLRVLREPKYYVDSDVWQPNDDVTHAYRALAEVQTMQALPTMMGRSNAQLIRALESEGWHRPWRQWMPVGTDIKRRKSEREEAGNIL